MSCGFVGCRVTTTLTIKGVEYVRCREKWGNRVVFWGNGLLPCFYDKNFLFIGRTQIYTPSKDCGERHMFIREFF